MSVQIPYLVVTWNGPTPARSDRGQVFSQGKETVVSREDGEYFQTRNDWIVREPTKSDRDLIRGFLGRREPELPVEPTPPAEGPDQTE